MRGTEVRSARERLEGFVNGNDSMGSGCEIGPGICIETAIAHDDHFIVVV